VNLLFFDNKLTLNCLKNRFHYSLTEELKELDVKFNKKFKTNIFELKEFFSEEFFITKKLIHIFK